MMILPSVREVVDLCVVLVSYNTREMTIRCLSTLRERLAVECPNSEILLVDNDSSDGTSHAIERMFPDVTVIRSGGNVGFGRANNLAFAKARGELILLLNTDAFPEPGAIGRLFSAITSDDGLAAIGPQLLNADGTEQQSWHCVPTLWGACKSCFQRPAVGGIVEDSRAEVTHETDGARACEGFVVGACLLTRRRVVNEVGGFDPGFFMYFEEAEWQMRMRDRGGRIATVPTAKVVHLEGASGTSTAAARRRVDGLAVLMLRRHGIFGLSLFRGSVVLSSMLRLPLFVAATLVPRYRRRAIDRCTFHLRLLAHQPRAILSDLITRAESPAVGRCASS